ncbi:MAG: hypothetical protein JW768_15510 [Chitinispirillaceae bacterium]|nr:hypothetical protein [Chitinispirillaceae bacterium]
MKQAWVFVLAILVFSCINNTREKTNSAGCGKAGSPTGVMENNSVTIYDTVRTYLLSVPEAYNPNNGYPVIWIFHGTGGTGSQIRRYCHIEDAAPENSALFVYPDGLPREGSSGSSSWESSPGNDRELLLFDSVMARLRNIYCIDEDRVFATGHSAGAFMSNFLGCFRGNAVTAIAPVAGGGFWWRQPCVGHVGVMVIHGTADESVSYESGMRALNFFLASNGCKKTVTPTNRPPCERYEDCYREMSVELCSHNGGHEWPDWAAAAIWGFFMEF